MFPSRLTEAKMLTTAVLVALLVLAFVQVHSLGLKSKLNTNGRATRRLAGVVPLPGFELSLRSPCKLNLFLRIMGRRPTGYRELAHSTPTTSPYSLR